MAYTRSLVGATTPYRRPPSSTTKKGMGGGGLPTFQRPVGGSGAGGGGGAPQVSVPTYGGGGAQGGTQGGAQATTQFDFPEAQTYKPFGGNPELEERLGAMADYGEGLMDPESDYYKRLSAEMQRQIGEQAGAQQRASALRGAWSGFGAGASPEQMATAADIGQAGLEAQGQAEANLALTAPQIGAGMLESTFQPELGLSQLGEGSRQFGAGLSEGARQFGAGLGLEQQRMAQGRAQFESGMGLEYDRMRQQAEQANQDAWLRELALQYGMV